MLKEAGVEVVQVETKSGRSPNQVRWSDCFTLNLFYGIKCRKQNPQESAHLHLTDLHYGKKTASFNKDVFKERLNALGDKVESIHKLLSHTYDFDKLVVLLGGDVNDGTEIYPSQAHHQDISDVEEQATELSEMLAAWITQQQKIWG